jgi:phage-related minor tail protein
MRKLKLKNIKEGKTQDLGNKLLDDKEANYEEKEDDENNEENEEESDSDSDDSIEEEKKDEKEKCDKKKKEEKQEDKKDKDEKGGNEEKKKPNKRKTEGLFDYFFLICITTIIGFFGKYYLCNILGYQIFNKDNMKNYKYFYYYIMIIYVSSIIVSLLLYGLFSFMFIPKKKKKEDKKDQYSLYQIFGFTIYKESLSTTNEQEHNNLCLCCESIRDCCDYILCYTNCTSCIFFVKLTKKNN